jgi:hypothetical protein
MAGPDAPPFGELEWTVETDPSLAAPAALPAVPAAVPAAVPDEEITNPIRAGGKSALGPLRVAPEPATRVGRVDPKVLALARGEAPSADATRADATQDALAAVRDLYARGAADEALVVAAQLRTHASSSGPAPRAAPRGHDALEGTAIARAGDRASTLPALISRTGVPRRVLAPSEVAQLALDHRAGFLLAHIDGMHSMEEILDVCAMPEAEALAILERLCALGVIALA